jgi:hypothetical protein
LLGRTDARQNVGMRTLLIGLVLSARALAAEPPQGAAEQLARHLMPPEGYRELIDQMSTQIASSAAGVGEHLPADWVERYRAVVLEVMPYEEAIRMNSRIYADHFTEREIGDLLAFYQTPTGEKYARTLPSIGGDVMREMMRLLHTKLPAALEKHHLIPKRNAEVPAKADSRVAPKKQ